MCAVQALFTIAFSYPFFYQVCNLGIWRELFVNMRSWDTDFVQQTYDLLVPEPNGPQREAVDTAAFFTIPMPKVYILMDEDITLGVGASPNNFRYFSDRLRNANNGGYGYTVVHVQADHEGMLSNPTEVARGILVAAAALGG